MRILLLPKDFPSQQRAHPGAFILRDARALTSLGHEVETLRIVPRAPAWGKWRRYHEYPDFEVVEGIPVYTIRAFMPPRMIGMEWVAAQTRRAIDRHIARFKPHVLHAHFLLPSGHAAAGHGVPAIVTAHGGDAYDWPSRRPGLRNAARDAILQATAVTAVSGFIRECVQRIAFRDVKVVYNGADDTVFYPRETFACRREMAFEADGFVVAFVGNLLRAKGLYELIDAASKLRDRRLILAIAGSGPDDSALRRYARDLRVDLRMLGTLPPERVAALMGAADVFALPSHKEGLPNVLCEAMACARAVIATTVGGIPEIVAHGNTGLLVEPGDACGLADALERLAGDPGLRKRMGDSGREAAARDLLSSVTAHRYESIYCEAISRFDGRAGKVSA